MKVSGLLLFYPLWYPQRMVGVLTFFLERISNRCAAVTVVSEVVGTFDQPELANKLSKSHRGHRQGWVDPALLFKKGACRAKGRPEIASTRRTYPPPCPPPQGGRKRFWKRAVEKKRAFIPGRFARSSFCGSKIFHDSYQLASPLVGEGRVGGAQEQDHR